MRHIQLLATQLFASLTCAATCAAQTTTLYDNFDNNLLDPSKQNSAIAEPVAVAAESIP
jgi:hypothetical protein